MEKRRKTIGRHLQRARRAAGYKSARAFAEAINVSYASVARAETGHEAVSDGVFTAIEAGLGLNPGTVRRYLRSGEKAVLDHIGSALPPGRRRVRQVDRTSDEFYEFIAGLLARYGLKAVPEDIDAMRAAWERERIGLPVQDQSTGSGAGRTATRE